MFYALILIILLTNIKHETVSVQGHKTYKEVYKKDFSEHCRRRVIPSVFLGRQVVEANSQILHFSKLDLPYSCFISVRSESGSNILLVLELFSHISLLSSCTKDADQLLIYEMEDTFGGYWGPLADNLINEDIKNDTKYYTIKTTPSFEDFDSRIDNDNEYEVTAVSTERVTTLAQTLRQQSVDYIEEEVPIVDVSGFLFTGVYPRPGFDIDRIFNAAYDISSRSGIVYDTTMLPLIQFSAMNDFNLRRNEDIPKYQIDYNISSLPIDIRLIYPSRSRSKNKKLYKKYKYNSNRLLNMKTNEKFFPSVQTSFNYHKNRNQLATISRLENVRRRLTLTSNFIPPRRPAQTTLSWDFIDTLLQSLNKTSKSRINEESPTSESTSQSLQSISEIKHNFNVYLSPNLSIYKEESKVISNHNDVTKIPTIVNFSFNQLNPFSAIEVSISPNTTPTVIFQNSSQTKGTVLTESFTDTYIDDNLEMKKIKNINNNDSNKKYSNKGVSDAEVKHLNYGYNTKETILKKDSYNSTVSPIINYTKPLRGSLVDRESWENIVQIAPVMADMLNVDNSNKSEFIKTNKESRRKKHINSISIDMAKPHKKVSRNNKTSTTNTYSFNEDDMQEFAQLVELEDDEVQGRVAPHHLPGYVGPVLFNICNSNEALARRVYLFNTSRIILAISNFTIDKMTLTLTPARTLYTSEDRCGSTQFECQVSGARVCIDSLTACDGVPNCGSYDIYDEDRLICGGATGLQHNVYLAAFTFLAVLLTLMYIIHYWLKRCVPRVSEAFFIYTEGFENMLYLDSIMKNPNDEDSKPLYQPNIFEVDLLCPVVNEQSKENRIIKAVKRILAICTCFLYKRKRNDKLEDNAYSTLSEPKRIYSFTELEIRKMLCNNLIESGVQTGDSLEMAPLNKNIRSDEKMASNEQVQKLNKADDTILLKTDSDELSIMNFFNVSRSSSRTLQSNTTLKIKTSDISIMTPDEKEIQSHVYEQQNRNMPSCSTGGVRLTSIDIHKEKATTPQIKHLRFEEGAVMIPAVYYNDNEDIGNVDGIDHRRSVVLGTDRSWNVKNLDAIEEIHEEGSNRDYIRFWSKSKRSKKPRQ